MADTFSRQLLAQGFSPKRIADGRRLQEEENALARILNQQSIDQNEATLAGTRLENKARARQMAQPNQVDPYKQAQIDNLRQQMEIRKQQASAPKPLTELQQKLEFQMGVPWADSTPEQRKEAFTAMQGSQSPMEAINLQLKEAQLAQQQAKAADAQKQQSKTAGLKDTVVGLATELLNHEGLDRSVGSLQGSAIGQALTVNEESQDFINKFDQLKSLLTAENLDLMTGVLSESDIKILSDIAGGGLKLRGSEEAFRSELEKLGGVSSGSEVTTQAEYDALPSGAVYIEDGVQYRKP